MQLVGSLAAGSPGLRLALEIERHGSADEILQSRLRPSWDQTGVPIHFHSSTISGPAAWMIARTFASVRPRQSPSPLIFSSIKKVLLTEPKAITLDLRALSFLNSSGINVLYKFAIAMRKRGELHLVVRGSKNVPWQGKSLPNLKKFNSNFEMILTD